MDKSNEGARILGIHSEGPCFALPGAHNPKNLRNPSVELAEELIDASNNIDLDKHFQYRTDDEIFFNTRKRDMHDLWHVTAGYGRDALGELSLLAFTYAQEQNRGIGAIALYGYWKVGKELPDFNLRKVIYEGYNNGKKATLWSCEDWESLIKLPLDQVREKLNSKKPELYYDALKKLSTHEIDLNNNAVLAN